MNSEAVDRMIDSALVGEDDAVDFGLITEPNEWELVAALLHRTLVQTNSTSADSVPADVVRRLRMLASNTTAADVSDAPEDVAASIPISEATEGRAGSRSLFAWAGWLAAAACLALAVFAWIPAADSSLDQQRQDLLAKADVLQVELVNPFGDAAAANATGDIVWSDERQRGFIRLRGVEVNDPSQSQYQLWIFQRGSLGDLASLEPHPVDGGVFNVTSEREVLIEIDAKLAVDNPTAFAITIEPPGGVVVSDRSRIPLVGDASAARASRSS